MRDAQNRANAADWILGAVLLVLPPALYLLAARGMGLWEPWETALASLGWQQATQADQNLFAPLVEGVPTARPWLQTLGLRVGYAIGGGTEMGLRLPFALLDALGAAGTFGLLRLSTTRWRALMAALLLVATPAFVLSSMTLAGGGHALGPFALTMALIGASFARPDRARLLVPAVGLSAGLVFWATGLAGLSIVLVTLALMAAGYRHEDRRGGAALAAGAVAAALIVLGGGLALVAGGADLADQDTLGAAFGAGFAAWGPVFALLCSVVAPAALLVGALPGARFSASWTPTRALGAAIAFAVVAGPGLLGLLGELSGVEGTTGTDALALLFGVTPMTGRTLPAHVTFDLTIRLVAFIAYPVVVLAPFAFGYLLRSSDATFVESEDVDAGARLQKQLVLMWMGVSFAVFGLSARHDPYLLYACVPPVAVAAGLAIGDTRFLAATYRNRMGFYTMGVASVLLLLMLSKDVRGTYNTEAGRPGPRVIFESLLLDGRVEFPHVYEFQAIQVFFVVWVLTLLAFFVRPLESLILLRDDAGLFAAQSRGILARVLTSMRNLATRVVNPLGALFDRLRGGLHHTLPSSLVLVAVLSAWSMELAFGDVPAMTYHFSQRGMLETYERFAEPGTPLHAVGVSRGDSTYYLREGEVERVARIADLRDLFCAEGRAFAIIPAENLGEAYYTVRRTLEPSAEGSGEGAQADRAPCPPQQLYVLDARSSRYLLVSDELHTDAGEEQQSYIAQNVFTDETLPPDMQRPEQTYTVDDRIELIGYRFDPPVIDRGTVHIETFWRVIETPRSGYKSFIHVDNRGNRINGDHELVGGRFAMNYWVPGEIVRDRHPIEVSRADRAGTYRVLYGFFRGDDRLRVEPAIGDNRIPVGDLEVRR